MDLEKPSAFTFLYLDLHVLMEITGSPGGGRSPDDNAAVTVLAARTAYSSILQWFYYCRSALNG